jgi:hypothetical protein
LPNLAVMAMPVGETFAAVTCPMGCLVSCCQRSGKGSVYWAPSGDMTSPMRSGVGVEAIPSMVRSSS